MKYKRIFKMLMLNGHSREKAVEIIINAKRNDSFAIKWIHLLKNFKGVMILKV